MMNFKQFRIVNVVLAIIGIVAFLYFQESVRTEEKEPFQKGTSQYTGYHYAEEHKLTTVDQCKNAKNNSTIQINVAFLEGCKTYIEK
jgi:uncharacterized protein YdeI (BOF family)